MEDRLPKEQSMYNARPEEEFAATFVSTNLALQRQMGSALRFLRCVPNGPKLQASGRHTGSDDLGDRLTITATDLELSIHTSCEAKVKKEGAGTIPAKKLLELVRLLPEAEIRKA